MHRLRSYLDNCVVLFLLAGLYPTCFLISRNWFIFTGAQMCMLLYIMPLVTLLAGLVFRVSISVVLAACTRLLRSKNVTIPVQPIARATSSFFALVMILFLLKKSLFSYTSNWPYELTFAILLGGIVMSVGWRSYRPLTLVLTVMTFFFSVD